MSAPYETATDETASAVAIDLTDERLSSSVGLVGAFQDFIRRVRGGDLGSLPVIFGLIVISIVFYLQEPTFLSSRTLVNITLFAAPIGVIAIGVVLVLLLGEIDLSVGSVSGLSAATMAVLTVYEGWPMLASIAVGCLTGLVIGAFYALAFTKVGVPSFVITLAGLLGFLGLQLYVLGDRGSINLPRDSGLVEFTRTKFVSGTAAYILVLVVVALYAAAQVWGIRRRAAANLSTPAPSVVAVKSGLLAAGLLFLAYYLSANGGRGFGYLPLLFVALVVVMDIALRRTQWGRHVFAVGGNVEAASRAGINVTGVYFSVFMLTGFFASLGGILAAGQLTAVSQASGGTDTNLTAIAAAVIGGTSLFGGRGTAYAALLGMIVLQSIQSGLNIIGVDSSVRFMVTGAVLLLAVSIDSLSRRVRSSHGRG